ncbi:peptidoglycan synthetase [Mucilaginibacter mali]|uniref:Peptidoglycan synthetase n=1 Tax=Mucilaginibacter mali TaxID=2740462 RepID=A0A7D4QBF9_9SPHI|nr:Mur ligase family protein [Mucilaginibacter mali]QKJ30464.1 peptidoglycan synthetase [Mucilaginibacter mali]
MKVHFIAVGGSAMHNLAIALHNKGFRVTGSDDVLFEPSRSRLAKYGILPEQEGWHPEMITPDLDAVILGMHARVDNPELLKAQELGLKIYSYPEYIYEQSKDKQRVVIGGSHGKTTITSMILHVLQQAGKDFDYLVGAQLAGFETMVKLTDAPIIVIEGDEYLASPIDRRPKFHLYKANIAVISGIAWDHINVFPTFDSYVEQFRLFIKTIQPGGKLIYSETDAVLNEAVAADDSKNIEKLPYRLPQYSIADGITSVVAGGESYPLEVFGDHNLLNMEAARLVCLQLGIDADTFYKAITTFKGAARRLELLAKDSSTNIYKDFAHSPSKLQATIHAVKTQFPDRGLVACIELHTFSSLNRDFLKEYAGTLDIADEAIVFIDKKTFEQKKMEPYDASVVKAAFAKDNLLFFNDPAQLKKHLEALEMSGKNLLLMSSGNFGGIDLSALANVIIKNSLN